MRLRSDEQLVALFRRGNEDAFRVIHDRYRQRLFAYTRQMLSGSRSDAEDALQDVFLRAYAALRADDRPVSLRAWLYRVAHNRCVDELRRPLVVPVELVHLSQRGLSDPLAEAERREDLRRLIQDLRRLPAQQRSALIMRELEGLSYVELATALGVSVAAVKSLLVRARIGLVHAIDARDAACGEIREDLVLSHGRGVRASSRVRRHLRDCTACREYRTALRASRNGLGGLFPAHPNVGLLAKLLGIGGGGAAAGGSAAAGGGAIVVGGGVATTAAKVAALVCCAAVVGTGAEVVGEKIAPPAKQAAAPKPASAAPLVVPARPAAVSRPAAGIGHVPGHRTARKPRATRESQVAAPKSESTGGVLHPVTAAIPTPVTTEELTSGGALAPEDVVEAEAVPGSTAPDSASSGAESHEPARSPTPSGGESRPSGPTASPAAAPATPADAAPAPAAGEASSGGAAAPPAG